MVERQVNCPSCRSAQPAFRWNDGVLAPCSSCGARIRLAVFPALFGEASRGEFGERLADLAEAGCFYHPSKRAAIACSGCGRFLCRLCDLQVHGRHVCPQCFDTGREQKADREFSDSAALYDSIALAVAITPMIIPWLTFVSAPIALFMVIRYWNRMKVPVPRTKIRFIAAGIIASLQLIGWVALVAMLALGA